MSERPPAVKVGDRVRLTTIHTGTVTEINDEGFQLQEESPPSRQGASGDLIRGYFRREIEQTWVVLHPEPPVGSVVIDKMGLAWQRSVDFSAEPWYAAADESDRSWDALNDERGPITVIYEGDGRC